MAQTILLKRSAVSGRVPTTSDLALGELGINTYDGKVYIKKDNGAASIIELTQANLANVTGTLAIANGGTGQTTANAALNALLPSQAGNNTKVLTTNGTDTSWTTVSGGGSGTVTSVSVVSANGLAGSVATSTSTPAITLSTTVTGIVKGNGTSLSAAIASDFPTLNQNTTGTAANVTGTVALGNGGTGATTQAGAANAVLPSQTSNSGKVLKTDGSNVSWGAVNFTAQVIITAGDANEYTLMEYATFAFTVNKAYYKTASGTITANVRKNGTSITGLSALSLTSTQGSATASAANTFAVGDKLSVLFSSNSSGTMVSVMLDCTKN